MKHTHTTQNLLFLLISFALFSISSVAFAKGSPAKVFLTQDEDIPLVVHNDSGVLFIDKNLSVFRTYTWKQAKPLKYSRPFYAIDLDGDHKLDFVGAGKPTFVLSSTTAPVWFDNHECQEVLVADFAADDKPDIACVNKGTISLYTYDKQLIWEMKVGRYVEWCHAEDLNGDQKADFECKYFRANLYGRFDGNEAKVIVLESKNTEATAPFNPPTAPIRNIDPKSVPARVNDVKFSGKPEVLVETDLNGDNKNELIVVTDKEIAIKNSDPNAKIKDIHLNANAKSYKRVPTATISESYTTGFVDDTAAKNALLALQEKLAYCYHSIIRKSAFAGSGRFILSVDVNDLGLVSNFNKVHSSLADKNIESCTENVIRKASFGKAQPSTIAKINLTLLYSFRAK